MILKKCWIFFTLMVGFITLATPVTTLADSDSVKKEVLESYADMANDTYSQTLKDAMRLRDKINILAENPDMQSLADAKDAWRTSRESYGQTEIFRLSNGPIDAEEGWVAEAYGALEGQLNAWPLDENMIDYTIDENGKKTSGNIIDTSGIFNPGGEDAKAVNVVTISVDALTQLNENGGDANVATGYHAIEFLLWGQDQDYNNFSEDTISHGALVAGQRPVSDFTTDQYAYRRIAYLKAASIKLVNDLQVVANAWSTTTSTDCNKDATGCYRAALLGQLKGKDAQKNISADVAIKDIITGMGVFIKSELANERIAVAVLTPSEEDEHSCFSDNTHRDISTNYQGFVNVLKGRYNDKEYGTSFYHLSSKETQAKLNRLILEIDKKIADMNKLAETKWHFDYQILSGNNATDIKKMKNTMRRLGDAMVDIARDIELSLTEDDVTDAEETKV